MSEETLDRKAIISAYMSSIGRKGGEKNKLKGSAYFSKISSVKKPRKK